MYKLKKSLGQHFLKDDIIVEKIMDVLHEVPFHQLLEVGPGGGALTRYLVQLENIHFKAVEIDDDKIPFLQKTFPSLKNNLIHQSFLDMEPPFREDFIIIGNFPYNISTQILFKILEWKEYVPVIIGMFQKEVAERVASKEGNKAYGVLSVLIQYYYEAEYMFSVAPESFSPPPKVQSGVIKLTARENYFPVRSEKFFRTVVKTAFNQRRKTLRNALKGLFPKEVLDEKLFDRRAETLSVKDFADLTFKMR